MSSTIATMSVNLALNNNQFINSLNQSLQQLQRFSTMAQNLGNVLSGASGQLNSLSQQSSTVASSLTQLSGQMQQVNAQANQMGFQIGVAKSKLEQFSETAKNVGSKLSMVLTAPLVFAGGQFIELASDSAEMQDKLGIVFGELNAEANKWADNFANEVGRSKLEIKTWMSDQQDIITGFGATRAEAMDMSQAIVKLAVDMGSLKNIKSEDAIRLLGSALRGESSAAASFGSNIQDVALKEYMLAHSYSKTYEQMTALEKVQLRLAVIQEQQKNSLDNATITAGSYANQIQRLKGNLKDMGVALGEVVLPFANKVVTALGKLVKAFEDTGKGTKVFVVGVGAIAMLAGPLLLVSGLIADLVLKYRLLMTAQAQQTLTTGSNIVATNASAVSFGVLGKAIQGAILNFKFLASQTTFKDLFLAMSVQINTLKTSIATMFTTLLTSLKSIGLAFTSFMLTPLGMVITAVGVLIGALSLLKKAKEDDIKAQERANELMEENRKLSEGAYNGQADKIAQITEEQKELYDTMVAFKELYNKGYYDEMMGKSWKYQIKNAGSNDLAKDNTQYEKINATMQKHNMTMEQMADRYKANEEAVKKNTEALIKEEQAIHNIINKNKEKIDKMADEQAEYLKTSQLILDNIKAYESLSQKTKRTADETNELAKAKDFLSVVVDKSNVTFDKNGKVISINTNALSQLKTQIENTRKAGADGITIAVRSNMAEVVKALADAEVKLRAMQGFKQYGGNGLGFTMSNSFIDSQIAESEKQIAEYKKIMNELAQSMEKAGNSSSYKPSSSSSSSSGTKKTAEQIKKEEIQMALAVYNHKKAMNQLTIQDEINMLEVIRRKTVEATDERMRLDEMLYDARKRLTEKTINDELRLLEHNRTMGLISEQDYLEELKKIRSKYNGWYQENIYELYEMDEKIYELRKQLEQSTVDNFQSKLEKAVENERDLLKRRREFYDEEYKNDVRRIEAQRDIKVKAFKEAIDAIDKASQKEDRDKEIARAKRLLKQYEQSLTESGQARAEELRRIIRDKSNEEIKTQVQMQIDLEEGKAKEALDQRKRQYDNDIKLIEMQEEALNTSYEAMKEKTKNFSADLIGLYGVNVSELQKVIEESALKELETKVSSIQKVAQAMKDAIAQGLNPILSNVKSFISNLIDVGNINGAVSLAGVNTNPTVSLPTSNNTSIVNQFTIENMNVQDDQDINRIAQALYNLMRNRR